MLVSASVYLIDCTKAEKTGTGCYRGVIFGALQKGDRYDLASGTVTFPQDALPEEQAFYRDYVMDGIVNAPGFDQMIDRYLLRGQRESMYRCQDRDLPYIKGGVLYEADGETYLVVLKYFKGSRTRGYLGNHASFSDVELEIDTTKLRL